MSTTKTKSKDWLSIGAGAVTHCWWFIKPESFTSSKHPTIHHCADTASLHWMTGFERRKQNNVEAFMNGFTEEAKRQAIKHGWEVQS